MFKWLFPKPVPPPAPVIYDKQQLIAERAIKYCNRDPELIRRYKAVCAELKAGLKPL